MAFGLGICLLGVVLGGLYFNHTSFLGNEVLVPIPVKVDRNSNRGRQR